MERLDLINGKYIEGVLISSIVGIALIFVAGASGLISIDTELLNLLPSLFFGSLLIMMFYVNIVKTFIVGHQSKSWPVTNGKILDVMHNHTFQSAEIKPFGIVYSYMLNGSQYVSSIFDIGNSNITMLRSNMECPYNVGQSVEVFYHPNTLVRRPPYFFHPFKRDNFQIDKKFYDSHTYDMTLKPSRIGNAVLVPGMPSPLLHVANVVTDFSLIAIFAGLLAMLIPFAIPFLILMSPLILKSRRRHDETESTQPMEPIGIKELRKLSDRNEFKEAWEQVNRSDVGDNNNNNN